jgi:beta-mannosidase
MTGTLDLGGPGWQAREALGLTWQWYVAAPLSRSGNNVADAAAVAEATPGWIAGTVPGSVIADLSAAGEIPDPYTGRNSRAAEWVAERSWVYRRIVDVPVLAPGELAVLEVDGVDPGGTLFWDGAEVGRVDGLYRQLRIDVTARATAGAHTLAVVLDPAPDSQPQVGRTELVRVHRPRMNEGWDFSPRLRHQGIWKGVRLVTGRVVLAEVTASAVLDSSLSHGEVQLRVSLDSLPDTVVRLGAELLDGGTVVSRTSTTVEASPPVAGGTASVSADLRMPVVDPRLWWPNGHGDPSLYTVRVTAQAVAERTGEAPVEWSTQVGFRNTRMEPNPGAPADALPYTLVVNDRVVPLVGWNWVPADALYGAIPAGRVEHLVDLAVRSGARLLRVWGGGLIETEEFYRACDAAGLLVWQEFSQSSSGMQSAPATDAEFVQYMHEEAESVVPGLAHHPSLVIWGGGNELDEDGVPLDDARSPLLAALHGVVATHDPARHWLPTSPTGPEFHNRLDRIANNPDGQHDVHGPWEHQGLEDHHTLYNAGNSLAHTEFGVEGMANLRSLYEVVPEADRWPADRSNPVYRHLGEWWNNAGLVQQSFGGRLDTLERMQRASQFMQATGLQYAIEADRRRAPRLSMVLPWQLNESYPNAWCTSSVDYRGDAKPAFYAVARSFQANRATIRVARSAWAGHDDAVAEAWVWSESGQEAGGSVVLRLRAVDGDTLAEASGTTDAVTSPRAVLGLSVPLADARANVRAGGSPLVLWEVEWRDSSGAVVDRDVSLASISGDLAGLLDLVPAQLDLSVETGPAGEGDAVAVRVKHLVGPAVVGLRLVDKRPADSPGWAVIDGDPRVLMPGEERVFSVHWRGDSGVDRVLAVESWNTEPVALRLDR